MGVGLLLMSIGGLSLNAIAGGSKESLKGKGWKLVLMSREIGVLLSIVAAFGMLSDARFEGWSKMGWVHAKITLWVLFVAGGVVVVKKPQTAKALWIALPILVGVGAWLAGTKPF